MAVIKIVNEKYAKDFDVICAIRYILDDGKRYLGECGYRNVLPLNADFIAEQFLTVQKIHDKTQGKRLYHIIVSFSKKEIRGKNEETLYQMAERINRIYGSSHQIIWAVHDKEFYHGGNLHMHMLVNMVSFSTGFKLQDRYAEGSNIKNILECYFPSKYSLCIECSDYVEDGKIDYEFKSYR